jgi:hypothetical protein
MNGIIFFYNEGSLGSERERSPVVWWGAARAQQSYVASKGIRPLTFSLSHPQYIPAIIRLG